MAGGKCRCPQTGKVRFHDEQLAKNALFAITRLYDPSMDIEGRYDGKVKRYYLCEHCHGWHLTSKPYETVNRKIHQQLKYSSQFRKFIE